VLARIRGVLPATHRRRKQTALHLITDRAGRSSRLLRQLFELESVGAFHTLTMLLDTITVK
jgi:hypothetical protein